MQFTEAGADAMLFLMRIEFCMENALKECAKAAELWIPYVFQEEKIALSPVLVYTVSNAILREV